jgi:acyl-CoA thioester hydrolase
MIVPHYFKPSQDLAGGRPAPAPRVATTTRGVRFNEVDSLNVLWHGHYASYFEDARVVFGERHGLGYQAIHAAGFVTPVKRMRVDYEAPLRFNQECRITAALFWSDAARLNFEYAISDMEDTIVTRGCTVQLFVTLAGDLCYAKPDFYEAFCAKWREAST